MNATAGAGPSEVVLFSEDFSSLPIRVIAGDYSPAGEYHVPAAPAESGRWREVVIGLGFGRYPPSSG